MKVAVSSSGRDLESQVDPRFGRSPYYIIIDALWIIRKSLRIKRGIIILHGLESSR